MSVDPYFTQIIVQPTTLCNLDCTYCYLKTTRLNLRMNPRTALQIAKGVESMQLGYPVNIIWHGGEPLATGIRHLSSLFEIMEPYRQEGLLEHSLQTNGTLIDSNWIEFFKQYGVGIGISIDGPEAVNYQRVDTSNRPAYSKILVGAERLRSADVPFSAIAVVSDVTALDARTLYQFFCELGCMHLAFNIEETQGKNKSSIQDNDEVTQFWKEIYEAWADNPIVEIREIMGFASWMEYVSDPSKADKLYDNLLNLLPSVGWNGDVVLLSPEFLGIESERYNFVVGNVNSHSLVEIVERGSKTQQVVDYEASIESCRQSCKYFDFCLGGWAINKYFENGTINSTETVNCRNMRQRLADGIFASIGIEM